MSQRANSHIYSVSKLNRFAKHILESEIGQIWLSAEISNFTAASSGHWYFSLKDERAQVRAAMFKGANRSIPFRPKEGDKLLIRGSISLYEARGDYQLIVSHMEPEGVGRLKQQFEQLKQQLSAEGLFASEHKKLLPERPKRVGVVTSSTGAALHDVLTVLNRRNPAIEAVVYPCQVQGETAANQIIEAIQHANARKEVDVLIVGRGGGSLEDMWCFNNEQLARTIFKSEIPIISAVGHEVDFTISDFVADARGPTPSAAAEMVSTPLSAMLEQLQLLQSRIHQQWNHDLVHKTQRLKAQFQLLQAYHPKSMVMQQQQTIDHLQMQLLSGWSQYISREKLKMERWQTRISRCNPQSLLETSKQRHQRMIEKLVGSIQNLMTTKRQDLAKAAGLLDAVSPLNTLSRGYTITYKDQAPLTSKEQVEANDLIETRFADGIVTSKVVS